MDIKNEGQGQVFDNKFLEIFTKAAPTVSAFTYSFIVLSTGFLAYQWQVADSFWEALAIFIVATLSWTVFEYFFHRYVNHLDHFFPESKLANRIAYTLHGIHHEYPRDKERLIMPPMPGILIASVLFGIFYLLMDNYALIYLSGFITGYLMYVAIHYGTHKFRPPKPLKFLWRHHALHHYKYPDKAFGVSTTFWDHVFRTMPPKNHGRNK